MDKIYVSDLKPKDSVKSPFFLSNKNLLTDKKGKQFLVLHLSDKTGVVHSIAWDRALEIDEKFQVGDIVHVSGMVQTYQGKTQLVVEQVSSVDKDDIQIDDFLSQSQVDSAKHLEVVENFVSKVSDQNIKQLLQATLQDPEIRERLLKYPAAKSIHHARRGGLIEHIASICGVMEFMAGHYPQLNKDLLIFGAIYHDIGKVWELSLEKGVGYSDVGRLVGHITIGVELIEKQSQKILGFPDELKILLKHIVLSHHGRLDYGSPKRPKTLEAVVVSMIDDLDSRIDSLTTFMKSEMDSSEDGWSRYSAQYDRYFYLNTLKEESD